MEFAVNSWLRCQIFVSYVKNEAIFYPFLCQLICKTICVFVPWTAGPRFVSSWFPGKLQSIPHCSVILTDETVSHPYKMSIIPGKTPKRSSSRWVYSWATTTATRQQGRDSGGMITVEKSAKNVGPVFGVRERVNIVNMALVSTPGSSLADKSPAECPCVPVWV